MVGPSVQSKEDGGEEQNPGVVGHPKGPFAAREEEVLKFWDKERIFEKSIEKEAPKGEFVFYDGPPFANGLPHYGHLLASAIKDAIPRYRTMQGYRVERQWGWDCHGLPVENLVEKELDLRGGKPAIEAYGIAKFNEAARVSIMKDVESWKRIIPRVGRWADMERDYKTMDSSYTESVWWAFKTLHGRGLIYESFKAMHYCPRCGTTLSNMEVAQGYKDIDDIAVTVRLPLVDEPDVSLLIWTTTPWTLPGNAAAAVKADAPYVKVRSGGHTVILAKALAHKAPGDVIAEFPGSELVGKRYAPPFNYFKNVVDAAHAWRVYDAPYVTMEDGTGIVHLAPAFGAEDLELAQKEKIPLIHHVGDDGKFIAAVADFAGLSVKPKGNPRETDEKIASALEARGLLFAKEKINHSYPHCWRCDTPLLNWAATSWFVNVGKIKSGLIKENANVGWVPAHVGEGRFGKWLEGARDWAISRSRYWGAPLPVWRNERTKEIRVMGSVEDLLSLAKRSGNRYFAMRHGEAQSNVRGIDDIDGDPENHLTEAGKEAARTCAQALRGVDMVFASPLVRTRETASIVAKELGLPESAVVIDERLRESGSSEWQTTRRRMGEFLFEIESRFSGKTILIVSHGYPLWVLSNIAERGISSEYEKAELPALAHALEFPFIPFPHNANFELDLHRPYIDDFDTGEWKRVRDVFDCWFESGSMPFASRGYPRMKSDFNPKGFLGMGMSGYPADFIAEGLDQTRGWFYSLIVLGVALFGRSPYRNVIVNGIVTAADGQKMSKRLKNYPDPMEVVEKYGADSLRYFLLSSSVVRGEDLRFSEKGVEEVQKKLLMRLDNVRSFLELYAGGEEAESESSNALDRWILSRLGQLVADTTQGFERYELDVAARPLSQFIDDLSTWYVRRSRDRFKSEGDDKAHAMATLRRVLIDTAKAMAPVMPFFAEDLYRRVRKDGDPESVHLCAWPEAPGVDEKLTEGMAAVRALASEGLELRERAGLKLRQPLARFSAKSLPQDEALRAILREELNVKTVAEDASLEASSLDTAITPELKEEGMLREWARTIQEWRKSENFSIADRPGLLIKTDTDVDFLKKHKEALRDATGLLSLEVREEAGRTLERM